MIDIEDSIIYSRKITHRYQNTTKIRRTYDEPFLPLLSF